MKTYKTIKALSKNIALKVNNEINATGDCCVETFTEKYLASNQKYFKQINNFHWKSLIKLIKIDLSILNQTKVINKEGN